MVLLNGAVQIKPYQTSPSSRINKYMWKWDEPPTQIWFINRRDNRIVILWRDGFVHLVEVQLVASGRKLPVPVFQASIWLLRCFLLFWTALSTKTPGKSWSEKVKRMEKDKDDACGWILHDITIIKSRWYKSWFSVLLPFIILDMAPVPASDSHWTITILRGHYDPSGLSKRRETRRQHKATTEQTNRKSTWDHFINSSYFLL
jgi:hypothetical protein